MSTRIPLLLATLALALAGCVDRGGWKPAPQLQPQALAADHALADAKIEATAWPVDAWWRAYGDPQLDELVNEALQGSPSLEIAQARLRAAQGQAIAAHATRLPRRLARRLGGAPALPRERPVSTTLRRQLVDAGRRAARLQL